VEEGAVSAQPPLRPGDVIAGKYRVERVLGVGGMGVVVAARHLELGRKVALKFMRADALDKGGVDRFLREARVAASIESDHVAQVLDVGRTQRGEPYLVMELLEGTDLSAFVARGVARTEDAAGWILEACEGLAAAHARGLVHRDVKPANLFVATRPGGRATLKVLDFGLARTFTGEDRALTTTGAVMGSPQYMAPEQLLARPLDARADVWALGVCLYELLTGAMPFEAPTIPALCAKILNEAPCDPCDRRPDLDHRLVAILARCLARDPAERFATVAELAAALEPYSPGAHGAAERVEAVLRSAPREQPPYEVPAPGADVPTRIVTAYDTPTHAPSRRPQLLAIGATLVSAAAIIALVVAQRQPATRVVVSASAQGDVSPPVSPSEPAPSAPAPTTVTGADAAPPEPAPTHTTPHVHAPSHPRPQPSAPPSANPLGRF
jgi:serine/threonine protein kinase